MRNQAVPILKNITIDKKEATVGEDITVTVTVEDPNLHMSELLGVWKKRDTVAGKFVENIEREKETIFTRVSENTFEAVIPAKEKDSYLLAYIKCTTILGDDEHIMNLTSQFDYGHMWIFEYEDLSALYYDVLEDGDKRTEPYIKTMTIKNMSRTMNDENKPERIMEIYPGDQLKYEVDIPNLKDDTVILRQKFIGGRRSTQEISLKRNVNGKYDGTFKYGNYMSESYNGNLEYSYTFLTDDLDVIDTGFRLNQRLQATWPKLYWKGPTDREGPRVKSITQSKTIVQRGEHIAIRLEIEEDVSGIREDKLALKVMNVVEDFDSRKYIAIPFKRVEENVYEAIIPTKGMKEGLYYIRDVNISDLLNNSNDSYLAYYDEVRLDLAFMVNEPEQPILETLHIKRLPDKLVYEVGEVLDLKGMELIGEYTGGEQRVLEIDETMVSGFDSTTPQESQKITVTVDGEKVSFNIQIIQPALRRISESNRFGTAVKISKASHEKAETVILVQSKNFPDALAAGPVAYMHNAPILLTNTDKLSSTTKQELERLAVKKVIIMGGEGAISKEVEISLQNDGYDVERLAGTNRYTTALMAAKSMEIVLGVRNTVVMASGEQFADALSAGSYAAQEGYPILLAGQKSISKMTKEYLKQNVKKVILVGGPSVIDEAVKMEIESLGVKVERVSGINRADTSAVIGKTFFGESSKAIVANGWDFADALSAAPYAAKLQAPIILVQKSKISTSVAAYFKNSKIKNIDVIGGEAAVGVDLEKELRSVLE